ncbi:LamG-like jellyroll fold domain-containing protein [Micromonospora sp. NPDC049460]|uniref:LamG-like jellyroll fold domain-containing protein n=1 Tax=unclassified Micromonospora TaxID=2617518 RepID=UPI00370F9FDC
MTSGARSTYDDAVLADDPVVYVGVDGVSGTDLAGRGHALRYVGAPATGALPNGDTVAVFDGVAQYAEIADADDLSVPGLGGILVLEAWVRPDALEQPGAQPSPDGPYVHFIGKGTTGSHEYAARMYSRSAAARPNRVSGYVFNSAGGLGAGSYWQGGMRSGGGTVPPLRAGEWFHYVLKIDTVDVCRDGWGTVRLYRNGVPMDSDTLGPPYHVIPSGGPAPLRIATRDHRSYFRGAIGKLAVYAALPDTRIMAHHRAMVSRISASATVPTGTGAADRTGDA